MAVRRPSYLKRQKEQQRQARAAAKREARLARRAKSPRGETDRDAPSLPMDFDHFDASGGGDEPPGPAPHGEGSADQTDPVDPEDRVH